MPDFLHVTTTTDSAEAAAGLARSAVEATLAGSAQVYGPARSFFWHHGSFGEGEEWLVAFKTTTDRYPQLEGHLLAEHPWDNPEVTAMPITHGSSGYLAWLAGAVSAGKDGTA